jgi:hypothetical protein
MPGYFDTLKKAPTIVAVPQGNVVQLRDSIHPYAEAIRSAWLQRLDQLQRPWVQGASWDANCFVTARKLIELTNSPWSGYGLSDARADYMAHAPFDSVWDKRDKCWDQARERAAGVALPEPEPNAPLPDVTVLDAMVTEAGAEGATTDDLNASWAPVDLTDVLAGTYVPELPSLMPRDDDACLLYPGRIHSFHGESESGKSLVAQAEAARLLALGSPVLFIDFESDHAAVVARLLELGATTKQVAGLFTYVRPEVDPRRFAHEQEAVAALLGIPYALAVIDGVTEALGIFGHSTKDNDDITAFMRLLPRTVARKTGAAVILVDHVTKDSESRGRFAIGGQAKMASLDGAAYVVEVVEALGRGRRGMVTLRVAKDRPGGVRAHAGEFHKKDRTQEAARIVVDSTAGDGIRVTVMAPLDSEGADEFKPTHIMEKISEFIERSEDPLSTKTIEDGVDGRAETVRKALAFLVRDHFVRIESGPRNAKLHSSIQPYREVTDPTSTKYVTTFKSSPRPTSSDLVPDEVTVTSSQPLRSRAGRDEVNTPRTTSPRPDEVDDVIGWPTP